MLSPHHRGLGRALATAGALLVFPACASMATPPPAPPHPSEIPLLEAERAVDGGNIDLLVRLGAAYREGGRLGDARSTLEQAVQLSPGSGPAVFYLALTYEDQEAWTDAAVAYGEYARMGESATLRNQAANRVAAMRRRALEGEVRSALAQEAQLANRLPTPGTIAVFPFLYAGTDPALRPIGRALAELLVTDLAQTDRLRVLERVRVNLLLEEIALGESDRVDPATAVRSGRILGAGRIVTGTVGGDGALLRLEGTVVPVGTTEATGSTPLSEQDRLEQFFDAQKRLVLGLYSAMGIELTPAERERVNQRPTENVQALLAYGLALEAEDRGDFQTAAQQYQAAATLDAGFDAARIAAEDMSGIAAAVAVGTGQLGLTAVSEVLPTEIVGELLFRQVAIEELERLVPLAGTRDPLPEVEGADIIGGSSSVLVELILRRPR